MESGRKSTGRTVTFKPAEEDGFQIGAGTDRFDPVSFKRNSIKPPYLSPTGC
jgi:hypothetical protein